MRFLKNLYYSPNIEHPKTVCWRLAHQAGMLSVYVLYLPEGEPARTPEGHNQLELCHSAFLQQPWFKKHPPLIVGIAMGREQALELVRTIVQEALDKNHDTGSGRETENDFFDLFCFAEIAACPFGNCPCTPLPDPFYTGSL